MRKNLHDKILRKEHKYCT